MEFPEYRIKFFYLRILIILLSHFNDNDFYLQLENVYYRFSTIILLKPIRITLNLIVPYKNKNISILPWICQIKWNGIWNKRSTIYHCSLMRPKWHSYLILRKQLPAGTSIYFQILPHKGKKSQTDSKKPSKVLLNLA